MAFTSARPSVSLLRWILLLTAAGLFFTAIANRDWRHAVADRVAHSRKPTVADHVRTTEWWGLLGTGALCAALAVSAGWWLRDYRRPPFPSHPQAAWTRTAWTLALTAVALGGWIRAPRLGVSVYGDEERTIRHNVRGVFEPTASGTPAFESAPWIDTLWENKEGNNPQLFSVLSRTSLSAWHRFAGHKPNEFSETMFRLPSFVAGLLTIPAAMWVLGLLGLPRAGAACAFLIAIHPWHIRYSAEGRGYALAMLFSVTLLACALQTIRTGQWRWWAGLGLSQVVLLWSYPGAIYVPVALHLGLIGWTFAARKSGYPVDIGFRRWLVANVVSGAVFLLGALPTIPQLRDYLALERATGAMTAGWLLNFWSYLSAGLMWRTDDPGNPLHVTVTSLARTGSPVFWMVLVALPLLAVTGLARLLAGGRDRVFAATALVLPVVLGFAHQHVSGHLLYLWYLIFALPALAILVTIGAETLSGFSPGTVRQTVVAGVLTAMVAVFGILTLPQIEVIRHHSKEQVRDAVECAAGFSDPSGKRQPDVMVINCLSHAPFYLPSMPRAHRPDQLIPLLDEAVRSGRPLYLIEGHEDPIRIRLPEIWTILQDHSLFEQIAVFPGLEERQFNHCVLRFHPERWSEIAETIRSIQKNY